MRPYLLRTRHRWCQPLHRLNSAARLYLQTKMVSAVSASNFIILVHVAGRARKLFYARVVNGAASALSIADHVVSKRGGGVGSDDARQPITFNQVVGVCFSHSLESQLRDITLVAGNHIVSYYRVT